MLGSIVFYAKLNEKIGGGEGNYTNQIVIFKTV